MAATVPEILLSEAAAASVKITELLRNFHSQNENFERVFILISPPYFAEPTCILLLFLMGPTYYKTIFYIYFFNKTLTELTLCLTEPTYNFCWVDFKS